MTASFEHVTQWQTMRVVLSTALDTVLADKRPGDLTAAFLAKMTPVAPATAVLIQPLVLGDDLGTFALTIYGFMNPAKKGGSGPILELWRDIVTAGGRVWGTVDVPMNDGRWGAAAAWRICDWAGTAAFVSDFGSSHVRLKADQDGVLMLPTLGYTHLLAVITVMTNVTKVGLLWRPISLGNVITKIHAFS